jgi:hypothetical protein
LRRYIAARRRVIRQTAGIRFATQLGCKRECETPPPLLLQVNAWVIVRSLNKRSSDRVPPLISPHSLILPLSATVRGCGEGGGGRTRDTT